MNKLKNQGRTGEGIVEVWDGHVRTAVFKNWITNKDLLDNTGILLNVMW